MSYSQALQDYQHVQLDAKAANANPVELVLMLLGGLQKELVIARAHIEANRTAEKGDAIYRCMNILIGLDSALEMGSEVADNLHQLYEYCQLCLFNASASNDTEQLDAVERVLTSLQEGWQGHLDNQRR